MQVIIFKEYISSYWVTEIFVNNWLQSSLKESEKRIWSWCFVFCILDRAIFMAVSSAIKILDIVGKLVENVSFELRKIAAAKTSRF